MEKLGLVSLTPAGQVVYVNASLETMLGYEPGKFPPHTFQACTAAYMRAACMVLQGTVIAFISTLWRHLRLLPALLRSHTRECQVCTGAEHMASTTVPVVACRLAGFLASKKLTIKDLVRPPYSQLGVRWMQQAGQSADTSAMVRWKGLL